MPQYVKVSEYAQLKDVHKKTVYRWVKNGDINAKEINGVLHVEVDDDSNSDSETNVPLATLRQHNSNLQEVIDRLQTQLEQAHTIIDNMQQKSQMDATIIMQLSQQLEQKTLALEDKSRIIEDMRNRSIWTRLKTAMGFSTT